MPWIHTIPESEAIGELARQYKRGGNPDGTVDNVLKVHSLSPPSLRAHLDVYIAAMHLPSPLTRIEREMVGVEVSRLNGCAYCVAHHATGLRRLLDGERISMADDLERGTWTDLSPRERAMLTYARDLTTAPGAMTEAHITALRSVELTDREILDLAQVVAYFCYANRMVLGLGAELEPEDRRGHHPTVNE